HPRGGFARRGAAAAAIVADAVFRIVGVVGVAGPILAGDLAIVLRALIDIFDHHGNRRAGGDQHVAVFQYAGKDLHFVGLAPLRHEARLARLAAVQLGLDVGEPETDAGRAAVDHA